VPLDAGTCAKVHASAPGMKNGDRPIFQVSDDLEDGLTAEAMRADSDDELKFRLCNYTAGHIDSQPQQYGFLVLR
jgi:hypothetical protein